VYGRSLRRCRARLGHGRGDGEDGVHALGQLDERPRVQVARSGGDLRVVHQRLDRRGVQTADGERGEVVAQMVEGQRGQAGGVTREPEAAAQSGVVDRVARRTAEDEVVGPCEPVTAAELVTPRG
jgi:hypothetical protein